MSVRLPSAFSASCQTLCHHSPRQGQYCIGWKVQPDRKTTRDPPFEPCRLTLSNPLMPPCRWLVPLFTARLYSSPSKENLPPAMRLPTRPTWPPRQSASSSWVVVGWVGGRQDDGDGERELWRESGAWYHSAHIGHVQGGPIVQGLKPKHNIGRAVLARHHQAADNLEGRGHREARARRGREQDEGGSKTREGFRQGDTCQAWPFAATLKGVGKGGLRRTAP